MSQTTNQKVVTCHKCKSEKLFNEIASCNYKGTVTYECLDEKNCKSKSLINMEAKQKKDKEENEQKNKYKHLPKEEQLKERYGVEFDDLEEVEMRFRDASIHYHYPDEDTFYSWSFAEKFWYKPSFDLRQYL